MKNTIATGDKRLKEWLKWNVIIITTTEDERKNKFKTTEDNRWAWMGK